MKANRKKKLKIVAASIGIVFAVCLSLMYLNYDSLKKTFIARISAMATGVIGQQVTIGNITFGPFAGVSLYHVTIGNPHNFGNGELLGIKKICLKVNLAALMRGSISFGSIDIYSPKLTLARDRDGRVNLSDSFIRYLSEKPRFHYQVKELKIISGSYSFKEKQHHEVGNINITLQNLSSEHGANSLITGSMYLPGNNEARLDGWINLGDKSRPFGVSLSAGRIDLSLLRDNLSQYRINTDRAALALSINAAGDAENGVNITAKAQVEQVKPSSLRQGTKILLTADAFLDIRDKKILIREVVVTADKAPVARLKGVLTELLGNPEYSLQILQLDLDLALFNLLKDIDMSGTVTADHLTLNGKADSPFPKLSGALAVKNMILRSPRWEIERMSGVISAHREQDKYIVAQAGASIRKAFAYTFKRPVDAVLHVNVSPEKQGLTIDSLLVFAPLEMEVGTDKTVYAKSIKARVKGLSRDMTFSGTAAVEAEDVLYGNYPVRSLRASATIERDRSRVTFRNTNLDAGDVRVSAELAHIRALQGEAGYTVEIRNASGEHPVTGSLLSNGNMTMLLRKSKKGVSAELNFSVDRFALFDAAVAGIAGSMIFDPTGLRLQIKHEHAPTGGGAALSAHSMMKRGLFPLALSAKIERIPLDPFQKTVLNVYHMPYLLSGDIESAHLSVTADSVDSWHGRASLHAQKIAFVNTDTKRMVLKEGTLKSDLEFKGSDILLMAEAAVGKIPFKAQGIIRYPLRKERTVEVVTMLPEIKVGEVRNSFWDNFPDNLLYVGLDGSLSSRVAFDYSDRVAVYGEVVVKDFKIEGENSEYTVGPVQGIIPFHYTNSGVVRGEHDMPSFEPSRFKEISRYYAQRQKREQGASVVTVGVIRYGFRLLEDVKVEIKPGENVLTIGHFNAKIFEGSINGSGMVKFSDSISYKAGLIIEDLSLKKLCDGIEPIKGYITGKVSGVALLQGSSAGLSGMKGKMDVWTYSTDLEKTKISKEFLQRIGGPSMKAYLGDRQFDKGIMGLYVNNGYLVFTELELSNKNIVGITDLSVKVAPLNNRIAIDHLMTTIIEAAQRTAEKK